MRGGAASAARLAGRADAPGVTWLGFRITPQQTCVKRASVARAKKRLAALAEAARRERTPAARDALLRAVQATFAH